MAIYELAYHLHMPVYKLLEEMPYEEFLNWLSFFNKKPVGWEDDLRTYKVLQALGVKAKPETIFSTIRQIKSQEDKCNSTKGIKGSALFSRILSAKGGDKLFGDHHEG